MEGIALLPTREDESSSTLTEATWNIVGYELFFSSFSPSRLLSSLFCFLTPRPRLPCSLVPHLFYYLSYNQIFLLLLGNKGKMFQLFTVENVFQYFYICQEKKNKKKFD